MAFVWSRLALAAVLAVGGATATAAASTARTRCATSCDEAPRLACATECPTVVIDLGGRLGDTADDPPIVAPTATGLEARVQPALALAPTDPVAAPAADRDVLAVAPKTSPPRS